MSQDLSRSDSEYVNKSRRCLKNVKESNSCVAFCLSLVFAQAGVGASHADVCRHSSAR